MRSLLALLAVLASAYLILVAALYMLQRQMLYLPDRTVPRPEESGVPDMSVIRLRTADGLDLLAWYRPARVGQATILYLHGNGGHIGYRGGRVRPFLDRGFGVLLLEYRGYAGNPGQPHEAGLITDARAAISFLKEAGVRHDEIVLYGESLGSAVAVRIAAEQAEVVEPVAAVVLEAPLSSVREVAAHHYPWVPVRWLLHDRFEAISRIAAIAAPLLIMHGDKDAVVPIRYGKMLFDAALQPKEAFWIAGGGHENLSRFGMHRIVFDFLARLVPEKVK
jgi:fermentation-respiration switch protein FrsA (DUF1100 family)